jgi:hypothetical protein
LMPSSNLPHALMSVFKDRGERFRPVAVRAGWWQ